MIRSLINFFGWEPHLQAEVASQHMQIAQIKAQLQQSEARLQQEKVRSAYYEQQLIRQQP